MESAKKRSESPLMKNKVKVQESDASENKDEVTEQIKPKKRGPRNKQKSHLHVKENGDSVENGNGLAKDEPDKSSQIESNENCKEKCDQDIVKSDVNDVATNNSCKSFEEFSESNVKNEANNDEVAEGSLVESSSGDEVKTSFAGVADDTDENESNKENCGIPPAIETENSADVVDPLPENSVLNNSQISQNENSINKSLVNASVESIPSVNGHDAVELDDMKISENHMNVSDEDSIYEEVKETETQASPDTALQEENHVSNKISNFLDNWSTLSHVLQDQKQDSETSSSKKCIDSLNLTADSKPIMHPYLSKVTGRPGIKGRSNLSSLKELETQTPKNKGDPLNDSFRVKSDPPRFKPIEQEDKFVLRKYKGKRSLNVNDEFEDGSGDEEMYAAATKRRKIDEKNPKSGFLGGMLWSPFKKKPLQPENTLNLTTETQSKLSRFLSPFWFWKKTVTDHERN